MTQSRGIYLISVVAETLHMHPQTLRKYERAGLIEPLRMGTLRTYSDEDVARLRLIKHFVDDLGLNLSGVEMALDFISELLELRGRLSRQSPSGDEMAASIRQVDKMLAKLGVKVVRREAPPAVRELPEVESAFKVNPGETLEFGPGTWIPERARSSGRSV